MAEQGQQGVGQVGDVPLVHLPAAVHHILPDDEAQLIAVVVPPLRLDLGVLAQQVEAQLLDLLQLVHHRRVRGRGIQPLRPVALVQQAVEEDGLSVEAEAQDAFRVRLTAPFAEGKITVHGIKTVFVPLGGTHGQVVEERAVRTPRKEMFLRDVQRHLAVLVGLVAAPVLGNGHAPGPHHSPEVFCPAGLGRVGFYRHGPGIVVRGDRQLRNVIVRHPLQPDGLPDAALGMVEHPAGGQGLLAPGLGAIPGGVLHGHPEGVAARPQIIGDVQRKGPVAAPVAAGQMAVDLHGAGVVHRSEVEQHPSALPRRGRKAAVVVEPLPGLQRPPHSGSRSLGRVGHPDGPIPRRGELCRLGKRVLPRAVQGLKAVPPQRRAGVFGKWVLHFALLFPRLSSPD